MLEVQGAASRLAPIGEIPPRAVGRLALGTAGYLVFDALRAAVGLRVAVRASPPYVDVAVMDGVALPERRHGERVKLATRARIIRPDGGSGVAQRPAPDAAERPSPDAARPEWTETVNLSEQGALLRRSSALEGLREFTLELMFGDDPQPVTAHVRAVRRSTDSVAVQFASLGQDDAARLDEYLMGARHRA